MLRVEHAGRPEHVKSLAQQIEQRRAERGLFSKAFNIEGEDIKELRQRLSDARGRAELPLTKSDLKDARDVGANYAIAAQKTYEEWLKKPHIQEALEAQRLNQKAEQTAKNDPFIASLLAKGEPERAREIIAEREQKERERLEREAQRRRNLNPGLRQEAESSDPKFK